jgi:NADH-quinone oxidoreductase subunit I
MAGYFTDIKEALGTVLVGMNITFKHLFTKNVTIQYPTVKRELPDRVRNRLYVNMDDCIGCDQCAKACPVNCIDIDTVKAIPTDDLGTTSTGNKKRLWVTTFDIDIAKCCYCGLCVYPCPTECIEMTDVFEFSEYDRDNLLYKFSIMSPEEVLDVQQKADKLAEEKARQKAEAAEAKKKAAEAKKAEEAQAAANQAPDAPKEPPAQADAGNENVKPPTEP